MIPSEINVLIACEESQAECIAFRERGFNAYSCDIQPCKPGGNKYWHIQNDVSGLLTGDTAFNTQAGFLRTVSRWHLIIAHPPCTYLCRVGAVHLVTKSKGYETINPNRFNKMVEAAAFFRKCLDAQAPFVAVENPIPMRRAGLPRPSCYADPSWFGVKYTKKTLYWLKNLPPLMPEIINPDTKCYVRSSRGKYRARTFPEMARAIAKQWGDYVLEHINEI